MLREALSFLIRYSGLPLLIRHTIARRGVSIVLYHNPSPDKFERHLAYYARRYRFITLEKLVDAIHSGHWEAIPRNALVITIDDGHRSNFALLPLFRKYGVRPTIYLCSQIVGTLRHFWFQDCSVCDSYELQFLPNAERLAVLRECYGYLPAREYPETERHALTLEEIEAMKPHVDFQSHTRFHPILTMCPDELCREEIEVSRGEVEQIVGLPCEHFCYTNGDYSEREIGFLKSAGYRSARTTDVGWNGPGTDPFKLKITGVTDDASVNMLAAQLSGITMYLRHLRRGSLTGKHPVIVPQTETR